MNNPAPPNQSKKMQQNSNIKDDVIDDMIEQIWGNYDTDRSGYLDRQETKKFVKYVMFHMGELEFRESEFE